MKNVLLILLVLLVFVIGTIVSFAVIIELSHLLFTLLDLVRPSGGSLVGVIFFSMASAVPLLAGFQLARIIARRVTPQTSLSINRIVKKRLLVSAIIGLYVFTWCLGVPAVQSTNAKWAIEEHKRIWEGREINDSKFFPTVRSVISFPILPFVVVTYHEYHLAYLYAWGGWDIQLWYLIDTVRLLQLTFWIS